MAPFDPGYTAGFYDRKGEGEALRWQSSPRDRVQHAVFLHHLRAHVAPGDRVLDAGSGPGIFAKEMLALGARVTCLDVSPVQLAACRARAPGCEAYELGSVTDLGRFADGAFDVALAYGGALSYCFDRAPQALGELVRVTRPGGRVGLSVMSLLGTLHAFVPGVLRVPMDDNRAVLATGVLDRRVNDGHECRLFRVDELRGLLAAAGLCDVELHANGWLVPSSVADIDPAAWPFVLEAELQASRESPGAGTHILAWARVP